MDRHAEHHEYERGAMAALAYIGLALALLLCVAAAALVADYWTDLDVVQRVVEVISGSLR